MKSISLRSGTWSSGPVLLAESFAERWRGLRGLPKGSAILIGTRSVHGFGLVAPFNAVGLTKDLQVAGSRQVNPNRIASFPSARHVLEMPIGVPLPKEGDSLEILHE